MNSSFYNGVSGIKTHQFGLDVWAHNISNVNNVGFKGSRPEFSNLFSTTVAQTSYSPTVSQSGLGATKQTTAMMQAQGSPVQTGKDFDMALLNEGWFGTLGEDGNTYFTRNGEFTIDANRDLVTRSGNFLLGTVNTNPNVSYIQLADPKNQSKINLPQYTTVPPEATTQVSFSANLDSSMKKEPVRVSLADKDIQMNVDAANKVVSLKGSAIGVEGLFDPKADDEVFITLRDGQNKTKTIATNLKSDLSWSLDSKSLGDLDPNTLQASGIIKSIQEVANKERLSTDVISANGDKNVLSLNYEKQIPRSLHPNAWNVTASITDKNGNVLSSASGEVVFGENGRVASSSLDSIGDISLAGTNKGLSSILGLENQKNTVDKDGLIGGKLEGYTMDDGGQIIARFNNGKAYPVAKVAVFHFQNDQGLFRVGDNYFTQSDNSGKPIFYKDENGNFINQTAILNKSLEMSNVELSTALTELIVMQKAFDASSKSITTSDQMIQKAINMKK